MNAYNIFGDIKPSNLKLEKNDQADNIWLEDVENPKSVIFKNLGEQKIDIKCALSDYSSNVLRTLSINVYADCFRLIKFTGGEDSTNTDFIAWLQLNATQVK